MDGDVKRERRLRVGIDAHALGSSLGGNATYAIDLLSGLPALPEHDYFIYVTNEAAAELAREYCPTAAEVRVMGTANPLMRLGWKLTELCRRDRVDVLHVQYVAPVIGPPVVATIHDVSFIHHPEWFTLRERIQFRLTIPMTARRARQVITISDYSRADLIRTLNLPAAKVSFSHLALRSIFRPAAADVARDNVLERLGIRAPYVLAVGNLQPRKNLVRLLSAWAQLRREQRAFELKLVLVGRQAWRFDEIVRAATDNEFARDVHLTGYVDDADLPLLYASAQLFVYPSLFEGFGYPPLEAMGCGAPVVTSRVTSLPEVCGDAAEYVNPESTDEIAAAMWRLHQDADRRAELRRRGLERAEQFRINRVAETAVAAYERAAASERAR